MKHLLTVTTVLEAGVGFGVVGRALRRHPTAAAHISGATVPLGRVAGTALLALGVACWLARSDVQSCAARGVLAAMLLYNFGAVVILWAADISSQTVSIALGLAVILHAAMAVVRYVASCSATPRDASLIMRLQRGVEAVLGELLQEVPMFSGSRRVSVRSAYSLFPVLAQRRR